MDEKKHERFCRVAEKRMEILIQDFQKLGNCASKISYEYSEKEVEQIFKELELQLSLLKERFEGKRRFTLNSGE